MSRVVLGTLEVISMRLSMPLVGVWTAEIEADGAEVALGATSIVMAVEGAPSVTFAGTVLEGGAFDGRARAFVVGGSAGLRKKLPARQYQLAPPSVIIAGILREAGEAAGELAGLEALAVLPRWVRSSGTGAAALSVLCRRLGITWRLERDGALRAGPEEWPAFSSATPSIEENAAHGRAVVARDAPDLEPGVMLNGRRVGRVVHVMREGGAFRSEVHFEATP